MSVSVAKLELSNKLSAVETESDKRLEELAAARSPRTTVEVLVCYIIGQSVEDLMSSSTKSALS